MPNVSKLYMKNSKYE